MQQDDLVVREADLAPGPPAGHTPRRLTVPPDINPDQLFEWMDRFLDGVDRFKAQLEGLRGMDGPQAAPADPWDDDADWERRQGFLLIEGSAQEGIEPPAPVAAARSSPGPPGGDRATAPQIDPRAIYQEILGALGMMMDFNPNMTVKDVLEYARGNGEIVVGKIAQALAEWLPK